MHRRAAPILLIIAAILFFTGSLTWAQGENPPAETGEAASLAPAAPDRTSQFAPTGYYLENGRFSFLPAAQYHAKGSFAFWSWNDLNPQQGVYRFNWIDDYINSAVAAGYQSVGIPIVTFVGRPSGCVIDGIEFIPEFVRNGPDGVWGNSDDPVVRSSIDFDRTCSGSQLVKPWYLPGYTNAYYKQQYATFINALANHLLNHPQRARIGWVAIGTGKDGENKPGDDTDDPSLVAAGLSQQEWLNFVYWAIDTYQAAFSQGGQVPLIDLVTQNAPFYFNNSPWERRDIAAHAASKNVGMSINNITSDFTFIEACGASSDSRKCAGMYDQALLHGDKVPVSLESYDYMMGSANEFYWSMARALDAHADYLRLSRFWNSSAYPTVTDQTKDTAEWTAKYLGKNLAAGATPPGIWSRMREHKAPTYLSYAELAYTQYHDWPADGNYEFFLYERPQAPGGVTIPITDDARFQTNGGITGWTAAESPVVGNPYHHNTSPYSPVLAGAGLYQLTGSTYKVQNQVDPGWVARKSQQSGGNFGFFFNADDRYITTPVNPGIPHKVAITVTYLDVGGDRLKLMYDSVSGEKAARVYAIADWTVRRGLAIDGGLPTSGVITTPIFSIQKTSSNKWKTATFLIEDGYFANRLPGSTDFYIDSRGDGNANDGDEYIHHVNLEKLSDSPQLTPTPTPTGQISTATATPTAGAPTATPTPTATPQVTTGTIAGRVFEDLNGNYIYDNGEPPVAGALMTLFTQAGSPIVNVVSDGNGDYQFLGVSPATYRVRPSPPLGWSMTQLEKWVVVQAGHGTSGIDFAAHRAATPTPTQTATPANTPTPTPTPTSTLTPTPTGGRIYGIVWFDTDRNGNIGAGENGVPGVTLQLKNAGGTLLGETLSAADGGFSFPGLSAQTYQLLMVTPPDWEATSGESAWLLPGTGALQRNFGLYREATPTPTATPTATPTSGPSGGVHAAVWYDANQNGSRDSGEPALSGVTVSAHLMPGLAVAASLETGSDGIARFTLPAPGNYQIVETDPWGLSSSTTNEYVVSVAVGATVAVEFGDYDGRISHYMPLMLQGMTR